MAKANRYIQVLERLFFEKYEQGATRISFEREELTQIAEELGLDPIKNLGDVVYSFNFRLPVPDSMARLAPQHSQGKSWVIRHVGRSRYEFSLGIREATPNPNLERIKVPDATPGIILQHALTDEQATLAKVRYNRLLDIFSGVTCYSLQSHLRTSVDGIGQIETDEVYVGISESGAQHVFPVEAKGESEKIGAVQIEQDFKMADEKFPHLLCTPIAAQSLDENTVCLIAFTITSDNDDVRIKAEKHYKLVSPSEITPDELKALHDQMG